MDELINKIQAAHCNKQDPPKTEKVKSNLEVTVEKLPVSAASSAQVPLADNLVNQWKAGNRNKNYLSNYRLYKPDKAENFSVDFPFGGKRVRKTLGTVDKDEAARRAVELIKAFYQNEGKA
jgi:hypothetical protein